MREESPDDVPGDRDEIAGEVTGATATEEAALQRVRTASRLLDDAVGIPGTGIRIGLDPILGVLPVAGDSVATVVSLYIVAEAYRLDVPPATLAKMLALIAVDTVVGSLPVVGTVFDAVWKANRWNVRTIERHVLGI